MDRVSRVREEVHEGTRVKLITITKPWDIPVDTVHGPYLILPYSFSHESHGPRKRGKRDPHEYLNREEEEVRMAWPGLAR